MDVSGDAIANVALEQFATWRTKRKPMIRTKKGQELVEWTPFSGIVVQDKKNHTLTCLASATGMKCLPQKFITEAQGIILHDWHAEILAIRSFNRFLLDECLQLLESKTKTSPYLRLREEHERTDVHFQPFALADGLNLHMYCSEAPCGDASMELTMALQEDATPWDLPPPNSPSSSQTETNIPTLPGRGYFSQLGIVRRKPARPDAPPTLSKSCSDKLAVMQSTSLLSSVTSLLISPQNMYLKSLVLPSSQLSQVAVTRAFSPAGRLKPLEGKDWGNGYAFKPFHVVGTRAKFVFDRRMNGGNVVPSYLSSSWNMYDAETIMGGTLHGRKQGDIKGASRVCQRRMWRVALEVAVKAGVPMIEEYLRQDVYADVKNGALLEGRRKVKGVVRGTMGGWVRNEGGEDFAIFGVRV